MEPDTEIAIGIAKSPKKALRIALSKLTSPLKTPHKGIDKVIIKPSIYNPKYVGNTSPKLTLALAETFCHIAPISVVESDNPIRTASEAFADAGYTALLNQIAELCNLSSAELIDIEMAGYAFKNKAMPSLLLSPHFLINAATVKLEPEICTVGGGIKNLFGLLPECDKSIYHKEIDDVLLDLLIAFRPDLTIIDLTEVVIGSRKDGIVRKINGVVLGIDPVAVDAYCCNLLDVNPLSVPHIKKACDLGLGQAMLDKIRVCGTQYQIEQLHRLLHGEDISVIDKKK
jgi:uncharacterized protein (DUF362 family)